MGKCVSKPPCFKFLMAGMRFSLPSGPFTTSMALTFYIRTLHIEPPRLFLRATMPSDARGRIQIIPHAVTVVRAMARTRSHGYRPQGGRGLEAAARNAQGVGDCTRRSRRAGKSTGRCPSHFAGAKQAEAVDQSVEWIAKGRGSVPSMAADRLPRVPPVPQPSRALKQQGVSATHPLARLHHLTGFAGDISAAGASARRACCPARGHGDATDDGLPAHRQPPRTSLTADILHSTLAVKESTTQPALCRRTAHTVRHCPPGWAPYIEQACGGWTLRRILHFTRDGRRRSP